jgi:16S rRNA (guanine(966)-N(2))-methyltransferase RsmD
MRITGGALRGRRIGISGGVIRPAMDRMRESVFGALGDLTGLSFLDIFSGSGIIALEAASRGADPVEAVEQDPLKRKTLLENVAIAPVPVQCRFMAAELYVKRAKKRFDLIFCDPPFPYRFKRELIRNIARSPLMGPGSRLLLHRPRNDAEREGLADPAPGTLEKIQSREYGRSIVDFFGYVTALEMNNVTNKTINNG